VKHGVLVVTVEAVFQEVFARFWNLEPHNIKLSLCFNNKANP